MHNRILDISDAGARLRVQFNQLVIERAEQSPVSIPLAELAVIVVAHPQVTYTQAVLSGLAAGGGVFVTCDERRLPVGILFPVLGHFVQAERIAAQARVSHPTRKRIWQQIVRAKIRAQADLLSLLHGNDHGLRTLIALVKSGDPTNVEARAARRYWTVIFGSNSFLRDRAAEDQNRLLNYGYAVLRAMAARAVCAAGLHPSLGIHHHNRYNAFCLADDLMEPFRVRVDQAVADHVRDYGSDAEFGKEQKTEILTALTGRCNFSGEAFTIFDTLARVANSLAAVFSGEMKELHLPERILDAAA